MRGEDSRAPGRRARRGDRGGAGRAGGVELSAGGYAGGRAGRAAGAAAGLCAVCRCTSAGGCCRTSAGIANLTAIPAGAGPEAVMAFDTGPGNMVMDWLAEELLGQSDSIAMAELAARGAVIAPVLEKELRQSVLQAEAAEDRGAGAVWRGICGASFLKECRRYQREGRGCAGDGYGADGGDDCAELCAVCRPDLNGCAVDYIVSGGGARNAWLMGMLRERLEPLGCRLATLQKFGLPAEAKEAAAFALLAWMTWHRRPGNVPSGDGSGARGGAGAGDVCVDAVCLSTLFRKKRERMGHGAFGFPPLAHKTRQGWPNIAGACNARVWRPARQPVTPTGTTQDLPLGTPAWRPALHASSRFWRTICRPLTFGISTRWWCTTGA